MDLYQSILKCYFGQNNDERLTKIKKLKEAIQKNKERINNATQMMLDGEINSSDYKSIKLYDDINTTLIREQASLELDKVDCATKILGSFSIFLDIWINFIWRRALR